MESTKDKGEITDKIGTLSDGRVVIARRRSSEGRATLEIYDPKSKNKTIIRYGPQPKS